MNRMKVEEFKSYIFQDLKFNGIRPISRKVMENQPVGCLPLVSENTYFSFFFRFQKHDFLRFLK